MAEPVKVFPKADQQYTLIMVPATGTAKIPYVLRAILNLVNKKGNLYAISFAFRQLKDHEKKVTRPFNWRLLLQCGEWTFLMNTFKQFILYTYHEPWKTGSYAPPNTEQIPTSTSGA
jgi:hypothetical protein